MDIKQTRYPVIYHLQHSMLQSIRAYLTTPLFLFFVVFLAIFLASIENSFADHKRFALPEFTADYAITKFGIKLADANYRLRHTEHGYHISQHTKLHGVAALFRKDKVDANSTIEIIDGQLRLQSFNYVQTGKEKNRNENLTFSYKKSKEETSTKITGISRSEPVSIQTNETVWDILSFQIPLMIEANANKKHYPYTAVISGELDEYLFNLNATKTHEFAGKKYTLLELVRTNTANNRALHIWLAPKLHNLPVIVENFRDGKLDSRMQLERVQFDKNKSLQAIAEIDLNE